MKIPARTVIIFSMILLGFFGLLTIISSQSETAMPYFLVLRQLISFAAALGLMFLCSLLPFGFVRFPPAGIVLIIVPIPLSDVIVHLIQVATDCQ